MSTQLSTTPKRVVRAYSQAERANACAVYDNIGSLEKASEVLGIPLSTLAGWVNDPANHSELRTQKAIELGDKFENAANLFIDLAVKKAKRGSFNHLVTASGIAVDKMQLLRGLPTSINAEVERQELVVILQSALSAGLEGDAIDVTPEPEPERLTDGTV